MIVARDSIVSPLVNMHDHGDDVVKYWSKVDTFQQNGKA